MSKVYPLKCRIIRNEGDAVTRLDVYDDIGDYGWFGGISAQEFVSQVGGIKGDISCHINSGGGDVFDGVAIANALRNHKGKVTTVVDGLAASIASVIAQAGQERVAEPGSMLMIHEAFGMCGGDAADMAKMAEVLDKVSGNIADIYAERAGGTPESWRGAMREESWYTAEEAVAAGLADKVGTGKAELPAGLDLAAFTSVPGRIAARLREMPVMKAPARPHDAGKHPVDGERDHSRDEPVPPDSAGSRPAAGEQSCEALSHQCCKDAAVAKDMLRAVVREEIRAASGDDMHGDHERWDPDGDGDCDACPEGDTDNDYWGPDGEQLRDVPGQPMKDRALTADDIRAIVREELALRNAAADESAWDGPAAMSWASSQDNPESAFRSICAGEKTTGEPDTQDHWALPHHKHAGDPPNRKGVSSALGYLNATQDLKNKGAAEDHLKAHQAAMGGDGAEDHDDTDISGIDLEEFRAGLLGLKGAMA